MEVSMKHEETLSFTLIKQEVQKTISYNIINQLADHLKCYFMGIEQKYEVAPKVDVKIQITVESVDEDDEIEGDEE